MVSKFNGLSADLGSLARLSKAQSRSVSAENPRGAKGRGGSAREGTGAVPGRELGQGWKISPSIHIPPGSAAVLAEIEGPGAINHIWLTVRPEFWRCLILRFYWDGEDSASIEVPLGDFFCNGWCVRSNVNSLPVVVDPVGGFNSYWSMPFRKRARITLENLIPSEIRDLYYQIDYALTDIPEDMAYFHAQWRRNNPLQRKEVHTLLDQVRGWGHYGGTYVAWSTNCSGWWGEGEVKFYLDGDREWPTICGTGSEDYFGGAWNFEYPPGEYGSYLTPYLGLSQILKPDGLYRSQQQFGMYRWHVVDPIRFQSDLRVTIQALGWVRQAWEEARYVPLQDDISSTAFWYQAEPHVPFSRNYDIRDLEVI